jgi:hypothetical protein
MGLQIELGRKGIDEQDIGFFDISYRIGGTFEYRF